jgi:hypothetical protein
MHPEIPGGLFCKSAVNSQSNDKEILTAGEQSPTRPGAR